MKYGFMAGCALSSSSPKRIEQVVHYLKSYYPDLSVIQACCGRPTKMIGQEEKFQKHFNNLTEMVNEAGIDELLVACQSCYRTINDEQRFKSSSFWVKMAELGLPEQYRNKAKDSQVVFSVQDSCSTREVTEIHEAVRFLIQSLGYKVSKNSLSGSNTMCCGMGGMCAASNAELSRDVARKRVRDFKTDYIVTYCSSCSFAMNIAGGKSWHLLDLIFGEVIQLGDEPESHPLGHPVTAWVNRYRSKKIVKKV